MKSRFWKSENNHNLKVTLGPHGTYPVWIRNGLVDLLGVSASRPLPSAHLALIPTPVLV
ncbi:hypothetical protein SNOG_15613 [Parastagonospora nodorum SN15]|uniref:Uncharacterized protein n=1 Tax=Phaeosphaeria nodorum (strain SN15 / ATCC MYA-4574 / FGSC 10173) TaxID=321614 RepID=Q0TXY8_PHANO|nr:hypothetical protein SNOG_15613 [Parastagonospora nodorum SN15]EAT76988.1 hypothetical protein SNOG_15613 [Parastagonospora nodorum SN15]